MIDAFGALLASNDEPLTVRDRVASAARDAALARGVSRATTCGRRDPIIDAQRMVVDLAHTHGPLGARIAALLRLDIGDRRRLAHEGRGRSVDAVEIHSASRHDRTGGPASVLAS